MFGSAGKSPYTLTFVAAPNSLKSLKLHKQSPKNKYQIIVFPSLCNFFIKLKKWTNFKKLMYTRKLSLYDTKRLNIIKIVFDSHQ